MCFGNGESNNDIELAPRRARQSPSRPPSSRYSPPRQSPSRYGEVVGSHSSSIGSGVSGRVVTIAPAAASLDGERGGKGKGRASSAGSSSGSRSNRSWNQMDWDAHPNIRRDYAGYKTQGDVHATAKEAFEDQKEFEKDRLKPLPKKEKQALRNAYGDWLSPDDTFFPDGHRNLEAHGVTWEDQALRLVNFECTIAISCCHFGFYVKCLRGYRASLLTIPEGIAATEKTSMRITDNMPTATPKVRKITE